MELNTKDILKTLNPQKIIFPILLGLGALIYLFFQSDELDFEVIMNNFRNANITWILLAFIVLVGRDLGYMYRIRHLTHEQLSWKSSFSVIMLWEFASAVTPSVVGGTTVAMFIISKEGINFGKSLAYVLLTAVLDNMFFVLASASVLIFVPFEIFPIDSKSIMLLGISFPLEKIFFISVTLIAVYTFFMAGGLFFFPKAFKWLLIKLTDNPILKRWKSDPIQSGDDMILASQMLKGENSIYWAKAILSTIGVWSARYLMLNCLLAAFTDINFLDHVLIFSRQIIMWIVMLISPTPGSTGTAEYFFGEFFKEFFTNSGFVLIVALFWRLFTYYAYLAMGAFVLPRWLTKIVAKELKS